MPVLKVKEDGVWKKVGSGSGSSGSCACGDLSASVGDITALTTTDKTSLVAAINELAASAGGSGSGDAGPLYVKIDSTNHASCTATEIRAAVQAEQAVFAADMQGYMYNLMDWPGSESVFCCATASAEYGMMAVAMLYVDEEGNARIEGTATAAVPQATAADYGKVLSATENGLVWVAQSSGGSGDVPSAEGVEF